MVKYRAKLFFKLLKMKNQFNETFSIYQILGNVLKK
jgi:hypothetical protein